MIYKMYTIRDTASEVFSRPFFARANGEAIRNFEREVHQEGSPMYDHPEHFSLWYAGDFADGTAEFINKLEGEDIPRKICSGIDFPRGE